MHVSKKCFKKNTCTSNIQLLFSQHAAQDGDSSGPARKNTKCENNCDFVQQKQYSDVIPQR